MAGLYIHVPFCKSRCIYCAFYSTTLLEYRQRYVDAVCKEIALRGENIDTIYLGGGTPSQLTIPQLKQLLETIHLYNKVAENNEITIECNPDDVSEEFASALPQLGINRVSMGAQTFDNERLLFLHRRHTAEQVTLAVERLRKAGIHNISIDLMYGFPNETINDWEYDVDAALRLDVEHLSAYCLMIEEGTLLYEQYEISNFAKPGFRSRHNSNYWRDIPYIGIGAAAHSYNLTSRSWNVADIHQYMEAIERDEIPCERELINEDTHYNDRITVALRTKEGLDLNSLTTRYRQYITEQARPYIVENLLRIQDHHLILTRKGLFVSDMVMSDLMIVD